MLALAMAFKNAQHHEVPPFSPQASNTIMNLLVKHLTEHIASGDNAERYMYILAGVFLLAWLLERLAWGWLVISLACIIISLIRALLSALWEFLYGQNANVVGVALEKV
ncbi:hypothetical protein BC834DRAFT_973558 [Gloeopeniophorella convolvens]|nr:hypothetical protein BC834DRAFT_973558 [Gloeopeniophorella convolvens]